MATASAIDNHQDEDRQNVTTVVEGDSDKDDDVAAENDDWLVAVAQEDAQWNQQQPQGATSTASSSNNVLNISEINTSADTEETSEDWLAHLAADMTSTSSKSYEEQQEATTGNHPARNSIRTTTTTTTTTSSVMKMTATNSQYFQQEPPAVVPKQVIHNEPLSNAEIESKTSNEDVDNNISDNKTTNNDLPMKTPSKTQAADAFADMISPAGTLETEASTVASTSPSPESVPSATPTTTNTNNAGNGFDLTSPPPSDNTNEPVIFELEAGAFGTAPFQPPPPAQDNKIVERPVPPPPRNEFQMVQLRRTSRVVERHMVETHLEFAEMVANTLTRKSTTSTTTDSSNHPLEVLRHMNSLQQEVAHLQSMDELDDPDGAHAIRKLRRELIDMFNRGGALQQEYLLQWLLPLHPDRDPTTGQYIMNANQVALLQQFSTQDDELGMVEGLGMVQKVLQMNFQGINGAQCLQAMHDYAYLRLGKKSREPTRTTASTDPWESLLSLVARQSQELDVQVRVRNALVQWVVREILGSASDDVSSKQCFHAIYLIATLKLELQRLAPQALEQAQSRASRQITQELEQNEVWEVAQSPARPPVLEQILDGTVLKNSTADDHDGGPHYRNPDTVVPGTTTPAAAASPPATIINGQESNTSSALVPHAGNELGESIRSSRNTAMDVSGKSVLSTSTALKKRMQDEQDLPVEAQDAHRVVRTILGPNHPVIHVSDCFEAIRIYSSLIMEWNEVSSQPQLEDSKPTGEELALRALEPAVRFDAKDPPLQVVVHQGQEPDFELSKEEQRRLKKKERRRKRKQKKQKQKQQQQQLEQQGQPVAPQLAISARMAENATQSAPQPPGNDDDVDVAAMAATSTKPPPPKPSTRDKMLEAQRSQTSLRQRLFSQLERRRNKREETRRKAHAAARANANDPLLASSVPETSRGSPSKKKRHFWRKVFGPKPATQASI